MKRIIISAIGGIGPEAKDAIPILSDIFGFERIDLELKRENFYNRTIIRI